MPYQLTGILKLPDGTPAANVDIEFISQANYSPLVRDLSNTIRTSATGSYSVALECGEYAIRLLYASAYPLHPGKIHVYAGTPSGQDLPTLMQAANWTPATPDYIVKIQNWLVEAKSAHDGSVASAAEAKASELAAKASEVAAEADRAEVATNKAAVSASQADVTTKQADVTTKAAQVASDKAAAEAAKVAAVAASDTAAQKAVLAAEYSALAQDAATRAEQSAQALVGALIDAGSYNAASGVLPTPVSVAGSERSCVWKVTGSGVAGGIELGVGDSLVYTTSDGSYYKIDNTESVTSVNGKKGVVSITASDVGADPSGTSSSAITQHEAKAGAHQISGVAGLQAALDSAASSLDSHKAGDNQHSISGVSGLQAALDGKQSASPALSAIAQATMGAFGHRNLLINGAMKVDQRNSAKGIANNNFVYGIDRWYVGNTTGGAIAYDYRRGAGPSKEFPFCAGVTTNGGTVAGNGVGFIEQVVESANLPGFLDVPLVLSFWVRASIAGTYSAAIQQANSTTQRTQVIGFTINAANTWEKKIVKFKAVDSSWVDSIDNTAGIRVRFTFDGNFPTSTPGEWVSSNVFTVPGQVQLSSVGNGVGFYLTGVQLERGVDVTPFEHKPYGYELSLCQRYYASINLTGWCWPVQAGSPNRRGATAFPVLMRAIPTVSITSIGDPITIHEIKAAGFEYGLNSGTNNTYVASYTATAEI